MSLIYTQNRLIEGLFKLRPMLGILEKAMEWIRSWNRHIFGTHAGKSIHGSEYG